MSEMVTKFSGKLFELLSAEADADNMICSPVPVSTVLAMALAWARGDTAKQIRQACGFDQDDQETYKYYRGLVEMMKVEKEVCKLSLANKIYVHRHFSLAANFANVNKEFFFASPETCDFGKNPEGSAQTINDFVEMATASMIKDIVKSEDFKKSTALVLVNAIYFKGAWETPFKRSGTNESGEFLVTSDKKVEVPMMHKRGRHFYRYCEAINAEMLEMEYEGGNVAMIFMLPFEGIPISDVEKQLKAYSWADFYQEGIRLQFVEVAIPRFKIESCYDLQDPLVELGITDAFDEDHADFSAMTTCDRQLFISKILQKAFIDVNEEGTEAAAATMARVTVKRSSSNRKRYFKCDRPFLFAIVSKPGPEEEEASAENIVPLFMGKVNDPSQK